VRLVIDIAYLLGTVGFFALMRAYVAGCARLGRRAERAERAEADR
jgi:hypothetical protein